MSLESHRRALQAAAKLAAVSLAACSGPQATPSAPEASATPAVAPPPVLTPVETAATADAEAAPKPRPPSAPAESKKVLACRDTVENAVKDGTLTGKPADLEKNEALESCCLTLAEFNSNANNHWAGHPCCSALNWSGGSACTPWGPPMPPCMPAALRGIA